MMAIAFLMIVEDLELGSLRPEFPLINDQLPSGYSLRVRRTGTLCLIMWEASLTVEISALARIFSEADISRFGLAGHVSTINEAVGHYFTTLDAVLGSMTYRRHPNKSLGDVLPKEKAPLVEVMRVIIRGIPRILPDMASTTLLSMLANYSMHLDVGLAADAAAALVRSCEQSAPMRAPAIRILAGLLVSMSDKQTAVLLQLMTLLSSTLRSLLLADLQEKAAAKAALQSVAPSSPAHSHLRGSASAVDESPRHLSSFDQLRPRASSAAKGSPARFASSVSSSLALQHGTPDRSQLSPSPAPSSPLPGYLSASVPALAGSGMRHSASNPSLLGSSPPSSSMMHLAGTTTPMLTQKGSSGLLDIFEVAEEACLLTLCSINAAVRLVAIDVLRTIDTVAKQVAEQFRAAGVSPPPQMSSLSSSTRVIQVMEELGAEVLSRITAPQASGPVGLGRPIGNLTFLELAKSDSAEHQIIWARACTEMAKRVSDLCPRTLESCWTAAAVRLADMQASVEAAANVAGPTSLVGTITGLGKQIEPPASDERLMQWRNYLVFVCGTATVPESQNNMARSPRLMFMSAKDVFRAVLPLLRSDKDLIVSSVVEALGSVNELVYKVLLDELKPSAKAIFIDDAKATTKSTRIRKMESLRAEISHIYHVVAYELNQSSIVQEGTVLFI